jgi:DNA segregation ATPase FtsK/SpoIIIE-like protein
LIAGTTGSGKRVFLKTLIASIMYHLTPDEARLVLIKTVHTVLAALRLRLETFLGIEVTVLFKR